MKVSSEVCFQPCPEGVIILYPTLGLKGAAVIKPGQVNHAALSRCANKGCTVYKGDLALLVRTT